MAKAIMIQGTMSNAGKSLVAAGLCRVFYRDGYKVAPFKSQNMALNSFITKEGLEMGRAQVVQAEACGIEPSVKMNPILLKPTTDMGSQVIVHGKPIGTMEAREYFRHKKEYIPMIMEAYNELASEHDIIVIEGAGSPAEINLKADDIVNMGMAKMADAAVLLVGDIDRGGVFAQLYGTVELLEQDERDRICGLIINKFRGDKTILDPGIGMIEDLTGKKVVGVIPYANVRIEDEDSLSEALERRTGAAAAAGGLDIAVIRLPKLSNFTDFQAFETEEDVTLRYVTNTRELGHPDLVILPGTKSTMADLKWLRETGLEPAIIRLHTHGVPVFGICGGYQMLGRRIEDPDGVEGEGDLNGIGLLPMITSFTGEKEMVQAEGRTLDFGIPALADKKVRGYEVHMGRTVPAEERTHENAAASTGTDQKVCRVQTFSDVVASGSGAGENGPVRELDGAAVVRNGGAVIGTYLHGVFDEDEFRTALLNWIAEGKGIDRSGSGQTYEEFRNQQMDLLAEVIRSSMDMDEIYRILGLPNPNGKKAKA